MDYKRRHMIKIGTVISLMASTGLISFAQRRLMESLWMTF